MIKITPDIWKFAHDSNVYYIESKKTIIDAGNRSDHQELKSAISEFKVHKVFLTHLHYDHVGNLDLFNCRYYAGKKEIECFKKDPLGTVLNQEILDRIREINFHEAKSGDDLEIIETPGHTAGSICIWYPKERILFSGDTMFDKGLGRTDLPTSRPDLLQSTVQKLLKLNHKILCPGHDY